LGRTNALVTLLLNNGRDGLRTVASGGLVAATEDNLKDWFVRLTITNTGISKTNNGTLTLRIDNVGTFIRTAPILVNEATKNTYLIELQLQQDHDNDDDFSSVTENGNILRAIIGQPQIRIDQTFGEILTIQLTGIEYRFKEVMTSEWHLFQTPLESFNNRLAELNDVASVSGIRTESDVVLLPQSPKISVKPSGPVTVHSTLTDIIDLLSQPSVAGGAFDDFYFDVKPQEGAGAHTNHMSVEAIKFGTADSLVTIDPLSLNVFDAEEENTIVTNNIEYKNNVIAIGTATGGSMPMERTRFASSYEHARIREEWDTTKSYAVGDLVKFRFAGTPLKPHLITYHRCISATTPSDADPTLTWGTLWEHDFTVYPNYITTSGAFYKAGEIVTLTTGGTVTFFQANVDGVHPSPPSANWTSLLGGVESSYTAFVSYTPWTNDVDLWKETLAGVSQAQGLTPTYEGWAFDWNITKANYNREDFDNHFEPVSVKVVTGLLGTQPTGNKEYDSQRYLLTGTPTGAEWSGNGDKIAEYDDTQPSGSKWKFSESPVLTDMVNNLDTGRVLQYDGANWIVQWNGEILGNSDRPSPFHICKNVGLIAGATGVSGQAVEFLYDWTVPFPATATTHFNRTSRGVWISQSFPLPRIDTSNFNVGLLYGGISNTISTGTIDTNNYDVDHQGQKGWNKGILDEDFGIISAMVFKMRVSMFRNSAGTSLVEGQPDIPMTFWCIDKFDRVWYSNFKLRRNGQWDTVRIPVGELAQSNLYFARWDELAKLNGVTITELDFTINEKEFTGVQFDWRFVKHWGCQLSEAYVETGLYKNGHQRAFEFGEDVIADLQANWYWYMLGPLGVTVKNSLPQHTPVTQNHIRFSAKIAIDDLHFEKEQVATSNDTAVTDPRTIVEHVSTENDYLNLKERAAGFESRARFFPQIWHIRATGDVRLQFGKRFTILGSRVPDQPTNYGAWNIITPYTAGQKVRFTSAGGTFAYGALISTTGDQPDTNPTVWENLNQAVVSEVTHTYDHDGYHVDIAGFRKFVVSG